MSPSTAGGAPTETERIAAFAVHASFDDIPPDALDRLKLDLLDALGCALGALEGPPVVALRTQVDEFGGAERCSLIGGGRTAPDRAASMTTAQTRYLDFMDGFMAKGETCHPSDNIGSVLAATEWAGGDGKDFLTALAVAIEVQVRLTKALPIMSAGFDHTTQLGVSAAAGAARALGVGVEAAANAIAISASDLESLAVIRASPTSQWKGMASSAVAFGAIHATFLASRGVTGPLAVFEGPQGLYKVVGKKEDVDWSDETLDGACEISLKAFNAEVHTQSALQALVDLRAAHAFAPADIERISVETFDTAYEIVGGGEYGDRTVVTTKEQADHSLPYLAAVLMLDGEVWPAQFAPDRIAREDVQALLRRVEVARPVPSIVPRALEKRVDPYTRAYPDEVRAKATVELRDGRSFSAERRDYPGFRSTPMSWDEVVAKFDRLASSAADGRRREAIVAAVRDLERLPLDELTRLLRLE